MTKLDDIERLAGLKKKGVITEEEFEAQKKALLSANEQDVVSQNGNISPWDRYIGCFKKYATFRGRANRAEYWWFSLFNLLAAIVTSFFGVLGTVYYAVSFLPGMAVAIRRLHDVNRSAWWYFLPLLTLVGLVVLLICSFIVDYATAGVESAMAETKGVFFIVLGFCALLFLVVWCIILLVFMLSPGTKGDNRYGKVPV